MGLRDWLRRKSGGDSGRPTRFSALSDQELAAQAAPLDWKATRTGVPGVLEASLAPEARELMRELVSRGQVQYMMTSGLGGPSFYAVGEPLQGVAAAAPGYAAAQAEINRLMDEKLQEPIGYAAKLPGWQSDYSGGYTLRIPHTKLFEHQDTMNEPVQRKVLSYRDEGGETIFTTRHAGMMAAIDAGQRKARDAGNHEPPLPKPGWFER